MPFRNVFQSHDMSSHRCNGNFWGGNREGEDNKGQSVCMRDAIRFSSAVIYGRTLAVGLTGLVRNC